MRGIDGKQERGDRTENIPGRLREAHQHPEDIPGICNGEEPENPGKYALRHVSSIADGTGAAIPHWYCPIREDRRARAPGLTT